MIEKAFLTLFLLTSSLFSFSQYQGKLRVFTKPSEAKIKLADEDFPYGKFTVLDTGTYTVKAWAPYHNLEEREIFLDSGRLKTVRIELSYTKPYKTYRFKSKLYTANKILLRYLPIITYAAFASSTYTKMQDYEEDAERYKSEALASQETYETAVFPRDFRLSEGRFIAAQANYEDAIQGVRQNQLLLVAGTSVALVATYFGWKLSNKLKKPSFSEEPLLSDVQLSPLIDPNASGISLTMKLR